MPSCPFDCSPEGGESLHSRSRYGADQAHRSSNQQKIKHRSMHHSMAPFCSACLLRCYCWRRITPRGEGGRNELAGGAAVTRGAAAHPTGCSTGLWSSGPPEEGGCRAVPHREKTRELSPVAGRHRYPGLSSSTTAATKATCCCDRPLCSLLSGSPRGQLPAVHERQLHGTSKGNLRHLQSSKRVGLVLQACSRLQVSTTTRPSGLRVGALW